MQKRLIAALDTSDPERFWALVEELKDIVGMFKVGMELFYAAGPQIVKQLADRGADVFLDLKLHDIPNTVAGGMKSLVKLGADMLNVHAAGGLKMMSAARQAADSAAERLGAAPPRLIAVTVLTSLNRQDLHSLGVERDMAGQVVGLAKLAREAGLDGVVASPREITDIKKACGKDFLTVTPGIRPLWAQNQDQARVMTPGEAVAAGGDYIVVGRPITAAESPREAALAILEEMRETDA